MYPYTYNGHQPTKDDLDEDNPPQQSSDLTKTLDQMDVVKDLVKGIMRLQALYGDLYISVEEDRIVVSGKPIQNS